jgi:hypothetical protein
MPQQQEARPTPPPQPAQPQNIPESQPQPEPAPAQNVKPQTQERAPSPTKLSPLELVQNILKEAEEVQQQVNSFSGTKGDKTYLYLEEILTRLLIKLDNIDSEGKEEIRNTRRQAVRTVQSSIDQLELKAFANDQPLPQSS